MSAHVPRTARAINLRIREDVCSMIDRAAKAHGKSRSDFIIDASRRLAEEVLLDQTFVSVDRKTYEHFLKVLDQPPAGKGFERLMGKDGRDCPCGSVS